MFLFLFLLVLKIPVFFFPSYFSAFDNIWEFPDGPANDNDDGGGYSFNNVGDD